jgi:hypothetical protein
MAKNDPSPKLDMLKRQREAQAALAEAEAKENKPKGKKKAIEQSTKEV